MNPNANNLRREAMRKLSPLRHSTLQDSAEELTREQMLHYGIDPESELGRSLCELVARIYASQASVETLWNTTLNAVRGLDRTDRIAYFNALKLISFQLAKVLDTLQNPFRLTYQTLGLATASQAAKGPYALFDNVTAIFSATPVITRTATYVYACAEWIEDAFKGQELMLEIYSRLLNPTSVCLANFIVDLEAGPYAAEYLAWNFDSGMAAIDGVMSHILGRDDILITSRNIYGGAHQLIHDWYAKSANLDIAVESFDGENVDDFDAAWARVQARYADRIAAGRKTYVYLESPCNPHGYLLDVPAICRRAHELDMTVMLDATVGTPFLIRPLQRVDRVERPDFVIHSYTKDLSGTGSTIGGVVIGRNEDMFIPKGTSIGKRSWNETLFWNVYYVKGAFLQADAAFEVIQGIRTLHVRMLAKCINTAILARCFSRHPRIRVRCNELPADRNSDLRQRLAFLGLPAPLFTLEIHDVPCAAFHRFFDALEPAFSHMISLGQSNTIVSCPALTTHSELSEQALAEGGITPTTIRLAIGDESPYDLFDHFVAAARLTIDPLVPGFSAQFPDGATVRQIVESCYLDTHRRYVESLRPV